MKLSKIRFSLWIISLLIFGCGFSTAYANLRIQDTGDSLSKFAPFAPLEGSLLFKAAIHVFGDYYSGLILIKELPRDSTIHVVFLSELGLNLLDLAYKNDEFEVVSVQEFLNRPSILKTLQKDFRTLLLDLSIIEGYKVKVKAESELKVLKFRHKSQRYAYSYQEKLGPVHIRRSSGLCGRVDFQIISGETINIKHRGLRLKISLTELNSL